MKISRIQTYLTHATQSADGFTNIPAFLLVSLQTTDGTIGWGEAFINTDNGSVIESLVLSIGQQVFEFDDINPTQFYTQFSTDNESRGFDYACAMSAIEIALWDLQGKRQARPVFDLIGKPVSLEIPVYANTWNGKEIEIPSLVEHCQALVAAGYHAIKIYPLKYGSAVKAGECVKAVREMVGNDIDILLDLSAITDPTLAVDCAREVAPYSPYWFEEPHTGDDLETLALIRQQTGLRIVTGEKHAGRQHFEKVLNLNATDFLNPDIAACGGILEILEIAKMAEPFSVWISPHCWNSMTVALAAMLQVCAVMPNADKAEIFPGYLDFGQQFSDGDFVIDNSIAYLGRAPGLGIKIDESILARLSTQRSIHSLRN